MSKTVSSSFSLNQLPHKPGVYIMRDQAGRILYIGKAVDLRKRVSNYFRPAERDAKIHALMTGVFHIDFIVTDSEREALVVEQRLIHRHKPPFNTVWRDDKSYPFVKISLNEDFPRIALTRKRRKDGAAYFGPFPRVKPIKRFLNWNTAKHLFPLRPCRWEFSEKHLPDLKKVQSCLYLHTGECPAPCVGKISSKEYHRIAEKAVLFFEGRHGTLKSRWTREMKTASKTTDFEKAARLRDGLRALDQMQQPVTFRALREQDVQSRVEASRAVSELQQALNLPRPPLRIEAFDISHSQGKETVASMVVFERGKPLKSDYRKFIVRTVAGVDDFASMEEVVERRYRRVLKGGETWPDLILIDGGQGQLSAALKALRKLKKSNAPIAALTKQEEEIYQPDQTEPLRLSKESPALQLLQHVRDESHRFAVTFHRSRRDNSLLSS